MKKVFLLIPFTFLLLFSSCSQLQEPDVNEKSSVSFTISRADIKALARSGENDTYIIEFNAYYDGENHYKTLQVGPKTDTAEITYKEILIGTEVKVSALFFREDEKKQRYRLNICSETTTKIQAEENTVNLTLTPVKDTAIISSFDGIEFNASIDYLDDYGEDATFIFGENADQPYFTLGTGFKLTIEPKDISITDLYTISYTVNGHAVDSSNGILVIEESCSEFMPYEYENIVLAFIEDRKSEKYNEQCIGSWKFNLQGPIY